MEIKTDGLVIKESYTGEADRIITVLTRDAGIIRAFAKGTRGIKSKNLASTSLMTYSSFVFYVSERGSYTVKSSVAKELFFALREDITKLSLAQYFLQLVCEFLPEEDECADILRLILNLFYFLVENKRPQRLLKAVAELRMVSIAGYMPSVEVCSKCEADYTQKQLYFSPSMGECFCREHLPANMCYAVSGEVIKVMHYIFYSDTKGVFALNVKGKTLEMLADISEEYLLKSTQRKFTALDFYKTVTI